MTSKICSVKKHPVVNFFKFTLKKQTPLTLLVTAFTLLFCPGMILSDANDDLIRQYSLNSLEFGMYSAAILGAALALVCMLLLLNFGFLFSKKAGDMYNALPFTRNELLLTRGVGALVGGFFLMSVAYFGLSIVNFLPTVDGVGMTAVINTYLFMVLSLMVLTAFCILIGICCGGYFDTVIAFGTINVAPVIILTFILGIAEESVTGIYLDYNILIYLTPIAFAINKVMFLPSVIEKPQELYTMAEATSIYTIIGLIVFGALCVFLTVKLFSKRKSETAGEAYSFKFMPIIISLLVSVVGGFFIATVLTGFNIKFNLTFWSFFVVCAILCAVAIGAIINRSFKYVKTFVINGIIASAVMTALVIGSLYIAGYAEVKIPKADDVETVYIGDIEFKENIDLAIKLHSGIIENLDDEEEYIEDKIYPEIYPEVVYNFNNFDFEYIMKNGSTIKRNYWYNQRTMKDLNPDILALMQTDEYLSQFDIIAETAKDQGIVSIYSFATKFGTLEDDGHQKIAILNQKDAKEFISIFKKEMKSADISVFEEEAYGVEMAGEIYLNLYIPESFTGTIDYLEGKFLSQTEQTD